MSLDRKINRIQFLSGNSLKVIAVLTMLIDHLCKIVLQWLLSNYWGAMADNGQMSWERFREIDYFIRFDFAKHWDDCFSAILFFAGRRIPTHKK